MKRLETVRPDLETAFQAAQEIITPQNLLEITARLATVHSPSGTVSYTLGPELASIMAELSLRGSTNTDYLGTKNIALMINLLGNYARNTPHVLVSHGDEVSYDVQAPGRGEARLIPLCAHRQNEGSFPALALRYQETETGIPFLVQVAEGLLVTDERGQVFFTTHHGPEDALQSGDRVVFNPEPHLELDPEDRDTLRGLLDNHAGVAIAMMVGHTLAALHHQEPQRFEGISSLILITDKEEGVPDPPVFGGGAKDFAQAVSQDPRFLKSQMIVNDIHDIPRGVAIPQAALIARTVSLGKGPTLDPDRLYRIRQLSQMVRSFGGSVCEDDEIGAYTSRSDDQGLRDGGISDRRISAIGYGGIEPHHGDGQTTEVSLSGMVATAQFLTVALMAAGKNVLY